MSSSLDDFLEFNEQVEGVDSMMVELRRVQAVLPDSLDEVPPYITDEQKELMAEKLDAFTMIIMQQMVILKVTMDFQDEVLLREKILDKANEPGGDLHAGQYMTDELFQSALESTEQHIKFLRQKIETLQMVTDRSVDMLTEYSSKFADWLEEIL